MGTYVEDTKKRWSDFQDLLVNESDRGTVLVSASLLDAELESLLKMYFEFEKREQGNTELTSKYAKNAIKAMFQTFGPLSTFSSRIKMAFLLNLLSETHYRDLEIIRKIRNKFAHEIERASFADTKVQSMTEGITSSRKFELELPNLSYEHAQKLRFLRAVSYIGGYLSARLVVLKHGGEATKDLLEAFNEAT